MTDTSGTGPNDFGYGQMQPTDSWGEFNQLRFLIRQQINKISTMTPVKVVACSNTGDLSAVGTVDVQPLVTILDGNGNATNHGELFQLPYFRLQGGGNAVICDPVVGDIGFVMFADQDISAVVSSKTISNPGSLRKFDMSDGVFIGGILNGVPAQVVQFTADGITLSDMNGNSIVMGPAGITITGAVVINGVDFSTHTHAVTTAPGETGPPV